MELYLEETRNKLQKCNYNNITIILGNESCDLDSAVCALVFAFYQYWQHEQIKCKRCTKVYRHENYKDDIFVPLLNVKRADIEIKTEIVYSFTENGIDISKLFFRDDLNFESLIDNASKTSVILVDHHVLSKKDEFLTSFVEEVIDHRPRESWNYKEDCRLSMEMVGSCATLVCDRIRSLSTLVMNEMAFFEANKICAELLYYAIILDTANFSKDVKKGTPKDEEMVQFLEENILKPTDTIEHRKATLKRLVEAKANISSLSVAQLLRKDHKVFGDVLVPGFPISVEELLLKPNAESDIISSLTNNGCHIAVLLGMKLIEQDVERDVAIYTIEDSLERVGQLVKLLEECRNPNFELVPAKCSLNNCVYYKQHNKAASRKQYVPVLNTFLSKTS